MRGAPEIIVRLKIPERSAVGAGSFTHLRHPRLGTTLHFVRGNVLDMLGKAPLVSEGIAYFAVTIPPELILQGHFDFRASLHGTIKYRIHVFGIDEERIRGDRS